MATRFADGHPAFMPIAAYAVLSPTTPSATWLPATPRCHVFEPLLRNWSVTLVVAAGCSGAVGVCATHAECRPLSVCTAAVAPPALIEDAVPTSHAFG